jgi:STIP1 family protein 1
LKIPEHLLCPISDDLMVEPVVISSGFTYEKSEIQKHFQINGNFDPLNREEVDGKLMITNFNIKHATEEYLRENPWAYEFTPMDSL